MSGFLCPGCHKRGVTQVLETRKSHDGIRRLRRCQDCDHTFTTFERIEPGRIYVRKKSRRREQYDIEKLRRGLRIAFATTSIAPAEIDTIAENVTWRIQSQGVSEVTSSEIGELVLQELSRSPEYDVAYVLFAAIFLSARAPQRFARLVEQVKTHMQSITDLKHVPAAP